MTMLCLCKSVPRTHNSRQYGFKKVIRPLRAGLLGVKAQHGIKADVVLQLLDRRQQQRESEVYETVDRCIAYIDRELNEWFAVKSGQLASGLAKQGWNYVDIFLSGIADDKDLAAIETKIKHYIQQNLENMYGVKSLDILAANVKAVQEQDSQKIADYLAECRRTMFITTNMTKLANKAWEKSLGQFDFHPLIGKALDKVELGDVFLGAVNCRVECQTRHVEGEMKKRLLGMLYNVKARVAYRLSRVTAQVFYDLYDAKYGRVYNDKKAELAKVTSKEKAIRLMVDNTKKVV